MASKKNKRIKAPASLKGLRVARYLRCSTDDQAHGDYTTIDVQDEMTLRFTLEAGAIDAGRYADEGRTGTSLERPDWRRLLTDAQSRRFDVVCATYMSRVGRGDAYIIAEYLLWNECRPSVPIVLVKETFADGLAGYMQKKFTNVVDGTYPEQVREWTMNKMAAMFDAGFYVGGRLPLGYKTVAAEGYLPRADGKTPRRMVPDEETRPLIVHAFNSFLRLRSVTMVAEIMAAATGRAWSNSQTAYLLRNRAYIGISEWNGMVREEGHGAIIDAAIFEAAQEILAESAARRESGRVVRAARRPDSRASEEERHAYYLRGLIFCGPCNTRMTTTDATGRNGTVHYYTCLRVDKYKDAACLIRRINADVLHEYLVAEIDRMAAHPWRVRSHIEAAAEVMPRPQAFDDQLKAARSRLRDIERRLDKLTEAVGIGGASVIAALARRIASEEEARAQLALLVIRLEKDAASARAWKPDVDVLMGRLRQFSAIWRHRTDADRSRLVPLLVDQVEMVERRVAVVTLLPLLGEDLRLPTAAGGFEAAMPAGSLLGTAKGPNSPYPRTSSSSLSVRIELPPIGSHRKKSTVPAAAAADPDREEVAAGG